MTTPRVQPARDAEWPDVRTEGSDLIRAAGVAGAGGAGFPSYAKWTDLDAVDSLLVNHQESEPNYYIDKWLGKTRAETFAALFDALLERAFDRIVVSAKWKDRDEYVRDLETETGGTVIPPAELPLDRDEESGVVFAYTENKYQYGMESVLLKTVDGTVIGTDLPTDHGWLVQNTETLYNIFRALSDGEPVTHKYVHVSGDVPRDRFLEVPIGTPASELLRTAGRPPETLPSNAVLADGGPGWCFPVEVSPDEYGVRKHTNCLLVLDEETVAENTYGEGRIDVLEAYEWTDREVDFEPTAMIDPSRVRIPLATNPEPDVVDPAEPVVEVGDHVDVGDRIARPSSDGISIPQHASIAGEVTAVSESGIEIESHSRV
ncbi:Respiratory-chain NADH dehydrogenase domain 51 kDa subunit [Haloterrigena turkmenica DSM 5511]|uniref:Respiratory-chain NADH dehydrogenase domain 51 kDa subunit n=1 Tax=Haloterrigena turkmenica (strain ATCC 51198 / DSM 5511 / JCM 9101 / NCIMB 13204 / VKM B-1734 / 4k) TaxID=543526 RepID=D2RZF4_HALTV|nr:NADH dehydrogenase [Haloterrigena turkmenica]ADB60078.1 Respiratory-chain NADH dehydrogenase domain 51 kDa subunit [Haloterrigena turkmenica DSM 5511]